MNLLICILAGLVAAVVTFVSNWVGLIPWRKAKGAHWTEEARLVFPVLSSAVANTWTVPGGLALAVTLWWPDSSPLWAFVAMTSVLGASLGNMPLTREVFPRIRLPQLGIETAIGLLLRFPMWVLFLGAAALMPGEFGETTWFIAAVVIALWFAWARGGLITALRVLGVIAPAPERLMEIAARVSARMAVPFREVLMLRSAFAQAFALIDKRRLLFTERLLGVLSDEEIAGVCAHELAHLTESRAARAARFLLVLAYWPWIFFRPMITQFGMAGLLALSLWTLALLVAFKKVSRRLESRADRMAKKEEEAPAVYARALARLYEDLRVPVVTAKTGTHPHLYDRLVAAGVTPDFPRPVPAAALALTARIYAMLVGLLITFIAIRTIRGN